MIAPGKLILTAAFALFLLDDADFATATATLRLRSTFDDRTREVARSLRAPERAVDKNLKLEEERGGSSDLASTVKKLWKVHPYATEDHINKMAVLAKLSKKSTAADNIEWLNGHAAKKENKRDARYAQWAKDKMEPEMLKAAIRAFRIPDEHLGAQKTLQKYETHVAMDLLQTLGWDRNPNTLDDWIVGMKDVFKEHERYTPQFFGSVYPEDLALALKRVTSYIHDQNKAEALLEEYRRFHGTSFTDS
uniref:Avirulence protein n=1 Tax=Peronospora matthiolae TaxID=2874970 RepID=A0AAV1UXP9_9STRA